MEHFDFRKRVRFSAPENATSPESELLRQLVSNLKKLDDLGLADDYIKRAVLEKYSRESNAGEFAQTLHSITPVNLDIGNRRDGARTLHGHEPGGANQAVEQVPMLQAENQGNGIDASTSPLQLPRAPTPASLNGSALELVVGEGDREINQAESDEFLRVVTGNTSMQEERSSEPRIPKNFQVM